MNTRNAIRQKYKNFNVWKPLIKFNLFLLNRMIGDCFLGTKKEFGYTRYTNGRIRIEGIRLILTDIFIMCWGYTRYQQLRHGHILWKPLEENNWKACILKGYARFYEGELEIGYGCDTGTLTDERVNTNFNLKPLHLLSTLPFSTYVIRCPILMFTFALCTVTYKDKR